MKDSQKHLTLSDRLLIEQGLNESKTFSQIARELHKDPGTISKGVCKHRAIKERRNPERKEPLCLHRRDCHIHSLCGNPNCSRDCKYRSVFSCYQKCDRYEAASCPKQLKAPYVCNGCAKRGPCRMARMIYSAKYADDSYRETLSYSREGINQTASSIQALDALISPLLRKGQSLAHIYANHEKEIPCCRRTLYSYLDQSVFSARNLDLPRKVRYRPRKKATWRTTAPSKSYRVNHTYDDFLAFLMEEPDLNVVEMDTVEGRKGGKVLLTMLFRGCSLMPVFLLNSKTQDEVQEVFDHLTKELGLEAFRKLFPVVLTDNGSEFLNREALSHDPDGNTRTSIYYCDPQSSWQKGRLEKNHEYIRYICPKGSSFDRYEPKDIDVMMNHINSTARDSLNKQTPYKLSLLLLDSKLHDVLSLQEIDPDEVTLRPELLR